MSLREAVATTVGALQPEDRDAALVALAVALAEDLDGAAGRRARADKVARRVADECGTDSALYEEVEALRAALAERQALIAEGRELRAALVELQATPKARGGAKPAASAGGGALAKLRAVR